MKVNLLRETTDCMRAHGKTPDDVRWVGSADGKYAVGWETFAQIADFEYDAGDGQFVARDLVVVGDGWWLERHEYDGLEWWEFKRLPTRSPDARAITTLVGNYFRTDASRVAELDEERRHP